MHFQHLTYWQDKAKNSAIENRLFINGAYCDAADNATENVILYLIQSRRRRQIALT